MANIKRNCIKGHIKDGFVKPENAGTSCCIFGDCITDGDVICCSFREPRVEKPRLLLHSCCAPCSSYVLAYLNKYFNITVFYYNPNITNKEEYLKRKQEQIRLISELPAINKINILDADYNPEKFFEISKGLENCREGGERCFKCYKLRLEATAKAAKENSFNYFCTTLTISPLKNAQKINEMGQMLGDEYQISFLPSDFKKKEGFKKSIELSSQYNLYRQNYCGCIYSKPKE